MDDLTKSDIISGDDYDDFDDSSMQSNDKSISEDQAGVEKLKQKSATISKTSISSIVYSCEWSECNESFTSESNFFRHAYGHNVNDITIKLLKCRWKSCGFNAKNATELMVHFSYHPYLKKLMCIGDQVKRTEKLRDCKMPFEFNIPQSVPFKCKWGDCQSQFVAINDFILHVNTSHVMLLNYQNEFEIDKRKSAYKKPESFKCDWSGCGRTFKSLWLLTSHIRSHTTERRIACPDCSLTFANKEKFLLHFDRQKLLEDDFKHNRKEKFRCAACCKILPSLRLLRYHVRVHINNVKCNICNMTLQTSAMLKRHVRYRHMVHDRPYKCQHCDQTTITISDLRNHLKIHNVQAALKCNHCEFECRSSIGLRSHVTKAHSDLQKPRIYACHYCSKLFENRGSLLTKHLLNVHKIKWPSGRSRFQYKLDPEDGFYRCHMMRFVSAEISQQLNIDVEMATTDSDTQAFTESEFSVDDSYYDDDKATIRSEEFTADDASFLLLTSETSNN